MRVLIVEDVGVEEFQPVRVEDDDFAQVLVEDEEFVLVIWRVEDEDFVLVLLFFEAADFVLVLVDGHEFVLVLWAGRVCVGLGTGRVQAGPQHIHRGDVRNTVC